MYVMERKQKTRITLPPKEVMLKNEIEQMIIELKKNAVKLSIQALEGKNNFQDKEVLAQCLKKFLADEYCIKKIARDTVLAEEDDVFEEEMDFFEAIGNINGNPSSIVKAEFKNLPWWERSSYGLPFEVISFNIIPDDYEELPESEELSKPKQVTSNLERIAYMTCKNFEISEERQMTFEDYNFKTCN